MKMEKVANIYKARFVVNISELGEDDPLTQNVRSLSFSCFFFLLIVEILLRKKATKIIA